MKHNKKTSRPLSSKDQNRRRASRQRLPKDWGRLSPRDQQHLGHQIDIILGSSFSFGKQDLLRVKILEAIRKDLRKLHLTYNYKKISYLGEGSFKFVFKVDNRVYKIPKHKLRIPRSRRDELKHYPYELDDSNRIVGIFNQMLKTAKERWKDDPFIQSIKEAELPPPQSGLLGCFFPYLGPSALNCTQKEDFFSIIEVMLYFYEGVGRLLIDAEIHGNIARNKLIIDLGWAIFSGKGRERSDSINSMKFRKTYPLLKFGLFSLLTLKKDIRAIKEILATILHLEEEGYHRREISETLSAATSLAKQRENYLDFLSRELLIIRAGLKEEDSKQKIRNLTQAQYERFLNLFEELSFIKGILETHFAETPSRIKFLIDLVINLDNNEDENKRQKAKYFEYLLNSSTDVIIKYVYEYRCREDSIRLFFSTHGKKGQTDVQHYLRRILDNSKNLFENHAVKNKTTNNLKNKERFAGEALIRDSFEKETLFLLNGDKKKGYQSSTTLEKKSGKASYFYTEYDHSLCGIEESFSLKKLGHSNFALILTILSSFILLVLAFLAVSTGGGALAPAALILVPILIKLGLGTTAATTVSKASLLTTYCLFPTVAATLMKMRKASIKSVILPSAQTAENAQAKR